MNRRILRLALPNIITNITVPLLGIVDMAIVGHLSAAHIGAITIGTSIFNLIYWNFGFLRMGTSGFTSQACGAGDMAEAVRVLLRAVTVGLAIAFLLLICQWPIAQMSQELFHSSHHVMQLAMTYFFIRIWAAPANLGLYAIKGWYIGMQNAKLPMWIAIFINVVNIICSLLFVIVLQWDIAGVALGTVIAQYAGLTLALVLLHKNFGQIFRDYFHSANKPNERLHEIFNMQALRRFFKVNGDIFLRTVCLAAVFSFITAVSGRISDEILAVDALLLQFFTLFSYIMDGFAYAAEALVGFFIGARKKAKLHLSIRLVMLWGVVLTVTFSCIYALGGKYLLYIFTDNTAVIQATLPYLFWTLIIPFCGFAAFLFDGIYVGATASRTMRNAMFIATGAFFLFYYTLRYFLPTTDPHIWNNSLWAAFMLYLTLRGLIQALRLRRAVYDQID